MDKLDKEIFENASKHLNREKAKSICAISIQQDLDGIKVSEDFCRKHGEALIYLEGTGELERVQEEIFNSDWYNSYFDEKGNLAK